MKNKNLMYWAVGIVLLYLAYRWYSKNQAGNGNGNGNGNGTGTGDTTNIDPDLVTEDVDGTGDADPVVARTVSTLYRTY